MISLTVAKIEAQVGLPRPLRRDRGLFAAIDLGTQASLLLIARIVGGKVQPVYQALAPTQIGQDLRAGGRIGEVAVDRLKETLASFKQDFSRQEATLVAVGATAGFRQARNGLEVLSRLSSELHFPCRPLTGEEEAALSWSGVANLYSPVDLAVLDIGGGSTEIHWRNQSLSLPLGAISLASQAGGEKAEALLGLATDYFTQNLSHTLSLPSWPVLVGGSALALAHLEFGMTAYDPESVEGCQLSLEALNGWWRLLADLTPRDRASLPGLDSGRAPVLLAGAAMMKSLADVAGLQGYRISARGLRFGLLLEGARRMGALPSLRD